MQLTEKNTSLLLLFSTALAIAVANSPLRATYHWFFQHPFIFPMPGCTWLQCTAHPLSTWINEGLMTFFFLLIGLELKQEFYGGDFSNPQTILLPACAALGGMIGPAIIYWGINHHDTLAMQGWAIATP